MNKENCYDIGTIQAFTDGELASDLQENVIGHVALCDSCATVLAGMEEESAFAFSVLDEELNVLVPTERLRTKVFATINESKDKSSWWQKVIASLGLAEGFSFRSPSFVAFASVVLFVSVVAIGVNLFKTNNSDDFIASSKKIGKIEAAKVVTTETEAPDEKDIAPMAVSSDDEKQQQVEIEKPVYRPQGTNKIRVVKTGGFRKDKGNRSVRSNKDPKKPKGEVTNKPEIETATAPPPSPNLSGEDSYLQTIATLSRTVDRNKDITLRPTERVSFEKDMAMVDDAIKKMKKEVRKNPKNQAAREVLRSSYKNKIDLLNSVAERSELMASIQ